jgi:ADP-heptose:LPS heptosyltransferase
LALACLELSRQRQLRPVVLGSPGQREAVARLRAVAPQVEFIDLVGHTSISQLCGLVSACDATIANDSGLMHLSAALGTPTVAIYAMTDPAITWCYDNNPAHRIVRRAECRPCYALDPVLPVRCEMRPCSALIDVDRVVSATIDAVAGRHAGALAPEQS